MKAGVVKVPGVHVAVLTMATAGLLLAGCASRGATGTPAGVAAYGAESAEAAIGRFLAAARLGDYADMARVFGTEDGPAERRWGRIETERRMFVRAGLLAPSTWRLRPNPISEAGGAWRWLVDLAGTRNGEVSIPFIVSAQGDRWFVERILTEALGVP